MKDNFSTNSNLYKTYRPEYPIEMYNWLFNLIDNHNSAWDCATGNGQIAKELSKVFKNVYATDISDQQLSFAPIINNVKYSNQPAEKNIFEDNSFDLITVGQAIHWFDFNSFYKEVIRTAKSNAIIAVIGYGNFNTEPVIKNIITNFYNNIIGKYWDKERKFIDENYLTIPFPFSEIKAPVFTHKYNWKLDQLIGYLKTWSAVKHYHKENNINPVDLIADELQEIWNSNDTVEINFPIISRIGIIKK